MRLTAYFPAVAQKKERRLTQTKSERGEKLNGPSQMREEAAKLSGGEKDGEEPQGQGGDRCSSDLVKLKERGKVVEKTKREA